VVLLVYRQGCGTVERRKRKHPGFPRGGTPFPRMQRLFILIVNE